MLKITKCVAAVIALGIGIAMILPQASADEIKMTFSGSTPPYTFPETGGGIDVEIIAAALKVHGHTLTPIFVPHRRILFDFKLGKVDAASKDHAQSLGDTEAYYGDVYVQYHDVIVSLADRDLKISQPDDLKPLSIIAFPTAPDHYKEWLGSVKDNKTYSETPNQELQVKMLHLGRTDVIVADKAIIAYLTKKLGEDGKVKIQSNPPR